MIRVAQGERDGGDGILSEMIRSIPPGNTSHGRIASDRTGFLPGNNPHPAPLRGAQEEHHGTYTGTMESF